jgi:hypothetical protein
MINTIEVIGITRLTSTGTAQSTVGMWTGKNPVSQIKPSHPDRVSLENVKLILAFLSLKKRRSSPHPKSHTAFHMQRHPHITTHRLPSRRRAGAAPALWQSIQLPIQPNLQ